VREQAARGLGRVGARDSADALRDALDDRIPSVRAAAASSLGIIRDRESIRALWSQAERDEFEPAQAAAYALVQIDPVGTIEASELESAGPHLREAVDLLEAHG
jgi:HEAT repeat protein